MKRMLIMMMVMGLSSLAIASTVELKDGRTVTGEIVTRDDKSVQLKVDGANATYYMDEIKSIDGQVAAAVDPVVKDALVAKADTPLVPGVSVQKDLVIKFMEVFGTRVALEKNFEMMVKDLAVDSPKEAQTLRERVKIDEVVDALVPLYLTHFTENELKAFIAFYESTEGKKLLKAILELMKESVGVSSKYIESKFPELKEEKTADEDTKQ